MRRAPPRHRDRSELITGLPAMLSIAWFPLATLLFQVTESAILVRDAVRIRFLRGRGDMNPTLVTRPPHVHDGKTPTSLGVRPMQKKWATVASSAFFAVGPDVSPE